MANFVELMESDAERPILQDELVVTFFSVIMASEASIPKLSNPSYLG